MSSTSVPLTPIMQSNVETLIPHIRGVDPRLWEALTNQLQAPLNQAIDQLNSLQSPTATTRAINIFESMIVLTGATLLINPPTTGQEHDLFILIVTQDGTGGRDITFGSGFMLQTTAISQGAGKSTLFMFMLMSDNNWWMLGNPVRQV